MLALFAWVIVTPTLATALVYLDDVSSLATHHDDGAPCPDGDGDEPCKGSCPCVCCPGHTTMMHSLPFVSLPITHFSMAYHLGLPETDPPRGIYIRVFRPPRV